jgi:hypothetical protein
VGPFRLASAEGADGSESPTGGRFHVFLDGFEAPLATGLSASDADALTRRFMSSIADWDSKLRATRASLPASSRRSSSKRASKHPSSRPKRRAARVTAVLLFVGAIAVLSGVAYYFGTTNPPDTTEPPPVRE